MPAPPTAAALAQFSVENAKDMNLPGARKSMTFSDSAYSEEVPDAADEFAWAEDDDYWVIGKMGMQMIAAADKKLDEENRRGSIEPRPKTPAEIAIEKSKEDPASLKSKVPDRRGACTMYESCNCKCQKYDPVIVLPCSLMSRSDLAFDFEPAAMRLVAEADLYTEGYWEEDSVKQHFYVYIEEFTPKPFEEQGVRCRIMQYRLRPDKALEDVREVPRLERLGGNINDILLPKLMKWCDEYYASKRLHEKRAAQEKIDNGHTAAHMVSIRDKGEFLVKDVTWRNNADLAGDYSAEQNRGRVSRPVKNVPIPHVDRPRHVCRCGHAEVWHRRADDLLDGRPPQPSRAANPIVPVDPGTGFRTLSNIPRAVLQRPDVMLKTGKIVMHDSASLGGMLD